MIQKNTFSKKKETPFRLFKNFGFMTLGKTLGDVFTFFLFVTFSRYFGQEGLGQYSFAIAFAGFLVAFSDFGLYHLSVKEMSRNVNAVGEYFNGIFSLRLILSCIVLLFLFAILPILSFTEETKQIILLIGLYQVLYVFMYGLTAVFVAREEMHLVGLMESSFRFSCAFLGIAFVLMGANLVIAISVFPVVSLIHIIIAYRLLRRKYNHFSFIKSVSFPFFIGKLREAIPYWLSTLLQQISTRVDVLFLGVFFGMTASGIYNAAYRIVFLLIFLPTFAGIAIFPLASRLYLESREQLGVLYRQALNLVVLLGLPATAGLCLIAPDLIHLIYGEDFLESILILQYLSVLVFLSCLKSLTGIFLTSCDLQPKMTKGQWKGAWVNILGNTLLIPTIGILGAAIATLISETLVVGFFLKSLQPVLGFPELTSRLIIASLATMAFFFPLTFAPSLGMWVVIPLAVVIYIATLLSFKQIRHNEFRLLMGLIRGR